MLSLPLIVPHDDHSIWHYASPHLRPNPPSPTNASTPNQPPDGLNGAAQHQLHRRNNQGPRSSALAALLHDENIIEQRKLNVRRFGAGWIRPPGIAKTYQAAMDEAAEREEQEMLARREAAMMELANAQEQEEEEARRREMIERGLADERGEGGEGGDDEGDADLDADVPDLDADIPEGSLGSEEEDDEDDDDDEEDDDDENIEDEDDEEEAVTEEEVTGDVTQDVTFNEESMYGDASLLGEEHNEDVENAQRWVAREEAEMAGDLQDERDLDDDVPEAGEYEHTDTEIEDITEEDLHNSSFNASTRSTRSTRLRSSRRGVGVPAGFENAGLIRSGAGGARQATGVPAFNINRRALRASFHSDGPSSLLGDESSFLESSPNAGRGLGRGSPSWMQPPPRPNWRRGPR
ncbi:replicase polyprotein 1a [Diplodia corticola]|uniref:Replicase polyprotein 1a n=1 Tax=Diplodia corticola TaxID=236234 RepID=A0A1J9QSV7_9PEZI|nr:replicase polyprotein 1a [Diplodia corticola]OJD31528.1 replicase polyprotein 1a [Diplodia corticola]